MSSTPLGSRRMVEDDIDQETKIIKFLGHGYVDVVEGVPVGFEGSLPDTKQDDIGDNECDKDNKEENKKTVGILIITSKK